ncbi:MAG: glutathione S-transferase N-terminal domain-containing protein [Deltaproteobacteria bacterium]|nr:glutathione S-transferase N-terminal domain-containing protein [Deltaproteobacteria bacterium]
MASVPQKIRPIIFVVIIILTSIAILQAIDKSTLKVPSQPIQPSKQVLPTQTSIPDKSPPARSASPRNQQKEVLSDVYYSGIESLKYIQKQVWDEVKKQNIIATIIARQTMYGLGEDVLLQDTVAETAPHSGDEYTFTSIEKKWLKEVQNRAASQDGFFLAVMGTLYQKGYGVKRSQSKAIDFWKKAVAAKYFPAYLFLGKAALAQAETTDSKLSSAVMYLKNAWEFDVPEAFNMYGELLFEGKGIEKNVEMALAFWRHAAMGGHASARFNLAKYFLSQAKSKNLNDENYKIGIHYLADAANEGLNEASALYARYEPIDDKMRKMQYNIDELDELWSTSQGNNNHEIVTYPLLVQYRQHVNITLYTSDHCTACNLVREYLTTRSISFTEFNTSENEKAEAELRKISPDNKIPTVQIDQFTLSTFSPSSFNRARDNAARNRILFPDSQKATADNTDNSVNDSPSNNQSSFRHNSSFYLSKQRNQRYERSIHGSYERIIIERGHYSFTEVYER